MPAPPRSQAPIATAMAAAAPSPAPAAPTTASSAAPYAGSGLALSAPRDDARSPEASGDASRILLRWLVGLRWAVFGLLAVMLPVGERLFGFSVNYAIALPVIAVIAVYNAWVHRRMRGAEPISSSSVALGVALDLVVIGAVLAASGGAANPFSAVFFVHVALAASLLPARTTFALSALAAGLFAGLFALPSGTCCPNHPAQHGAFSAHLYGMLLAFVVSAGLVAYFLTRVRRALDERGQEIAWLRRQAEEGARFAALGTLAAGTAHELATPLGTIAVLAGEITDQTPVDAEAYAHAAAIRAQVTRCRDVLRKMQAGAASAPLPASSSPIGPAVRRAVTAWRKAHPGVTVELREEAGAEAGVRLSSEDIEAAVCALLDNALHAMSGVKGSEPIAVRVAEEGGAPYVRIEDAGAGVAPHLTGRLGEPFLTTKQPGEGMGLGLYLVRTLIGQVGGRLEVSPRAPRGTCVTLRLAEARA